MRQLIEKIKEQFDVILFDCPPILGLSDASLLSELAQGSIIVTQHRKFPRSMLVRVKTALQNIGTPCLGAVLNQVDVKYDETYLYYTSYGHYYTNRKSKAGARDLVAVSSHSESSEPASTNGSKPERTGQTSDQRLPADPTDDAY
jgi:Mrp family chromosome partitioning ATPase